MEQQVNDWGKLAGSITAILGLLALILINPIKRAVQKKKEQKQRETALRKEAEQKAQEEVLAFRQEVRQSLQDIQKAIEGLQDDIGDLQYERLSQAHEFYTDQGWCPGSKKEMLCEMHRSYQKKGRNHLSEHYEEEILSLPSKPPQGS